MRLALRLAWRDAWRHRARSALVLVMIALPVLGVTAADIVYRSSDVSGVEEADRILGGADAMVWYEGRRVEQLPDPYRGTMPSGPMPRFSSHGPDDIGAALGRDVSATLLSRAYADVPVPGGLQTAEVHEYDAASPLTAGLARLTAGRWPTRVGEMTVNDFLVDRGLALGQTLEVNGRQITIVGLAEDTSYRGMGEIVAAPGSIEFDTDLVMRRWLVSAGAVTWSDVRRLNATGAVVYSRAVIADPPPDDEVDLSVRGVDSQPISESAIVVAALIAAMVLLEVALLAGPAFAVGTRRLHRTIALIGASGGTPRAMRRVVLAQAVVLGTAAAVLGVVAGLAVGRLALPLLQPHVGNWFGPYEVPWLHLVAVALLGVASAVLAAAVPAFLASRLDVVGILSGRRGEPAPSKRVPILGLLVFVLGCAGATSGALASEGGEVRIAGSAIVVVIGMVMVIPLVLGLVARLGRWLPMSLRYALRDAARHRTRTAPAVAAVAATVAGLTALGIGVTSDEAENRHTYRSSLPVGMGLVATDAPWTRAESDRVAEAVRRSAPGASLEPVMGVPYVSGDRAWEVFAVNGERADFVDSSVALANASVPVGEHLPRSVPQALPQADAADEALASGRVVVFTSQQVDRDTVRIRVTSYSADGRGRPTQHTFTEPALFVTVPDTQVVTPAMVLPPGVASELGVPVTTTGLVVEGSLSEAVELDVQEAVAEALPGATFWVERGYVAPDDVRIVELVLAALAAVLMLAGTLTATFLALADARPDLATLSAVGAAPRTRRSVAAAYALVVALLGAVLGALVGMVPGLAVAVPLTNTTNYAGANSGPFIAVPWPLIAGVVGLLPLVIAAVVWLTARSRLPMTARVP